MPKHDEIAPLTRSAVSMTDSLRAVIAGGEAAKLVGVSARIFEAGGKHVLSASAQRALRKVAEQGATRAIAMATGPVLETASGLASGVGGVPAVVALGAGASRASRALSASRALVTGAGKQAMGAATKEVLKGAGRAAGIGFVFDGAVASLEAIMAVRNGSSDRTTAIKYVAKEASTGALATGAGVLLGASLVALTGGIGAPVVFAVGALGSIGTKRLLRRIVR